MPVTLANNALFADLTLVKEQLKIASGESSHDDYLKMLINSVSSACESMLKVPEGNIIYKGYIKKREVANEVIFMDSGRLIETICYPVVSVTKVEYTSDWTTYTDYLSPYVKINDFQIQLINDYIKEVAGASRLTYKAGYETIPDDILLIALEMMQRKYDESGLSGNRQLGLTSMNASGEGSTSINFTKLEDRWIEGMRPYKKVITGRSLSLSR